MKKTDTQRQARHEPFAKPVNSADLHDTPPPRYQSKRHKKAAITDAVCNAAFALHELRANAAAGDNDALESLLGLLCGEVNWLDEFSYRQLEQVKRAARLMPQWPVMLCLHPLRMADARAQLGRLEVGTQSGIDVSRRAKWGIGKAKGSTIKHMAVASLWANGIIEYIRRNPDVKRKLKPLSKSTADQWFKIGWQAILEATKGRPEEEPELRELGDFRRRSSHDFSEASALRSGIRERIREALVNLAAKSSDK